MTISLAQADMIVSSALRTARERGAKPLAVLVVDAGGHPVAFRREDGASLFRWDIARAKAVGALGMGCDTREIAARASGNQGFYTSVAMATGGLLAFSPGGVLVRNEDNVVIGAIGISGDTGDTDEACAIAGITSAGLLHGVAS
jgi:uncharacterized protein GlcG (DUF336 family)